MSSPVTPMTPVTPPPRRQRRRSFAGPVVLIILGVVFLLGNLHMLAWRNLGTWFAHYWPALLTLAHGSVSWGCRSLQRCSSGSVSLLLAS